MTPQEKAKELFEKFSPYAASRNPYDYVEEIRECALIAVEEKLNSLNDIEVNVWTAFVEYEIAKSAVQLLKKQIEELEQVKEEIEKL